MMVNATWASFLSGAGLDFAIDFFFQFASMALQVVMGLTVNPETCARTEVASQAQRRVWSDAPASVNYRIEAISWNVKRKRERIKRNLKGLDEFLVQNLAQMGQRNLSFATYHDSISSLWR